MNDVSTWVVHLLVVSVVSLSSVPVVSYAHTCHVYPTICHAISSYVILEASQQDVPMLLFLLKDDNSRVDHLKNVEHTKAQPYQH